MAQLSEEPTTATATPPPEEGPVELPPSTSPIFATNDEPTPLQTATSVLLTGAITVFLFRSLRRRAKRAKETKFRSSSEKKSFSEEALESLKSVTLSPAAGKSPPSPVQAFLGALAAGAITIILYKFTTTIESSLNRQTIPDNYSVRQITITIRTIINGLCYLATFVFGINSLGLLLYSAQLAFNSIMESSSSEGEEASSISSYSKPDDTDNSGVTSATTNSLINELRAREMEMRDIAADKFPDYCKCLPSILYFNLQSKLTSSA
ncbi:transmembrane protein [Perilla frutescens var. frutescens]|nr:transmembrane protein [Perilla frutescens var. frutescens]